MAYKAQYNRHVVVVPGEGKDASFEFKATVVIVVVVVGERKQRVTDQQGDEERNSGDKLEDGDAERCGEQNTRAAVRTCEAQQERAGHCALISPPLGDLLAYSNPGQCGVPLIIPTPPLSVCVSERRSEFCWFGHQVWLLHHHAAFTRLLF